MASWTMPEICPAAAEGGRAGPRERSPLPRRREQGVETLAGLDEATGLRHQTAGVNVSSNQMTPAEHEAAAGDGRFQHLGVVADDLVAGPQAADDPRP